MKCDQVGQVGHGISTALSTGLSLSVVLYIVYARSKGSGEIIQMCMFIRTFAALQWDKYQNTGLDEQKVSALSCQYFLTYVFYLAYVFGAEKKGLNEYPQHMFWLENKKIIFLLRTLNCKGLPKSFVLTCQMKKMKKSCFSLFRVVAVHFLGLVDFPLSRHRPVHH